MTTAWAWPRAIFDVTTALEVISAMRYPAPLGDQFIANFPAVVERITALNAAAPRQALAM